MMKYLLFLTLSLLSWTCNKITAQTAVPKYSKVKVMFSPDLTIVDLAALGVEADHGIYEKGRSLTNVFSENEIARIRAAGFDCEILIDDMSAHYIEHMHDHGSVEDRMVGCDTETGTAWQTPSNYTYGSMGGYHTWEELLDVLDNMAALFPDLISIKQPISDTLMSHEGRPIYWLRISDNPGVDEDDEPEALYTALHHAREPNSLSQMLFFMWYLLENYNTDPEIKYLVDNSELYFIPCINPDGYVYNQTTNPQGGGFWRKNRRTNGDGSQGVDLNRNYGHQWGIDDQGSSPAGFDDAYRGPAAFSEPETRAVRFFCENHDFKTALNAHTYSNLLIYPWGYNDQETPDSTAFRAISALMTEENSYLAGLGVETVGYAANGVSDDWMYGAESILSMTPEIGVDFWPPQSTIDGQNKDMMLMNMTAAWVLHNYGRAKEFGDPVTANLFGEIPFELQRLGLADGSLTVSLEGLSSNIISTDASLPFNLNPFEKIEASIGYELSAIIADEEEATFLLTVSNGNMVWSDTIRRTFSTSSGIGEVVFEEMGEDVQQWNAQNGWGISTQQFVSAPSSIADSPNGSYPSNTTSMLTTSTPVDLSTALSATLEFQGKWAIEKGWDYAQVMGSTDGNSFVPLCGKYTVSGTENQDENQPVYDGTQSSWVSEKIDLTDYLGGDLYLRFRLVSDPFLEEDGFYFDDLEVKITTDAGPSSVQLFSSGFEFRMTPNPASGLVQVSFPQVINFNKSDRLEVFSPAGKLMKSVLLAESVYFETGDLATGIYICRIHHDDSVSNPQKLVVTKP